MFTAARYDRYIFLYVFKMIVDIPNPTYVIKGRTGTYASLPAHMPQAKPIINRSIINTK